MRCGKQFTMTPVVAVHGIRIVGYHDGMFSPPSGNSSPADLWNGEYTDFFQDEGSQLFAWDLSQPYSITALSAGKSDLNAINFTFVYNAAYSGGSFGQHFICSVSCVIADAPGFIVWTGVGPNDPGWSGIGPPNIADAVGVYTRVDNGPSNLNSPATITLELF